ncbi:hypothetical protein V1514DRAFT_329682 [Lipomyces japonicus]|uniref:uncharacterized protein n=1 Tax=Lipomyces japonicus TaxID=56871 RepID=UPI0034CD3026
MLRSIYFNKPFRRLGRQFATSAARRIKSEPDVTYTTLNNENAQEREQFFKYTWGSWTTNDDFEKARRYTPFSIEGVAEIVRRTKNLKTDDLYLTSIASISEGRHHHIYLAEFNDETKYVLRIPYPLGLSPAARKARMQSEVATMDFAKKKWKLQVPEVISWSPTADNPLESEYVLLELIDTSSGGYTNLMRKWDPIGGTVKERALVIKSIIDQLEKLLATRFNAFGSLYFTDDVTGELQSRLPYSDEEDASLIDRWRIGPTVEKSFWLPGIDEVDTIDRGPWSDPKDYLRAYANAQVTALKNTFSKSENNNGASTDLAHWIEEFQKFQTLAPNLVPEVPEDSDLLSPRLSHPDLSPINILAKIENSENEDFKIADTFLLDFEGSSIKPFFLHGTPEFVRYDGYKVYKKEEISQYEELPLELKQQVDFMLAATASQYTYEFLFSQAFPTLISAYSPNVKILTESYRAVSSADFQYHPKEVLDVTASLIKTQKEWQFTSDKSPLLHYTEEEIAKNDQDLEQWQKEASQIPFYSTKGWVPEDIFEESIKSGSLVKDEQGNYVNSQN